MDSQANSVMQISDLAWEMAQYEVHALRNELNGVTMRVAVYAHHHPDARTLLDEVNDSKEKLDADSLKALRNPAMRKVRY
jgi:hypothetical protein